LLHSQVLLFKGSALFLAELSLLKQFLGLTVDAAKVVLQSLRAQKTSSVLSPARFKFCATGLTNKSWRPFVPRKTQSFPRPPQ
jgi:hypothetical protein